MEPQAPNARKPRRTQWWLLLCAVLALAAAFRALAPWAAIRWLNGRSADLGGYALRVADVDVRLFGAAYDLRGIAVRRNTPNPPRPIFEADRMTSAVDWREAWKHPFSARVEAVAPRFALVHGNDSASTELGTDLEWGRLLARLAFPRVNRVELRDGEVRFWDLDADPVVELSARELRITGGNLLPNRGPSAVGPTWTAQGRLQASGIFFLGLSLAPPGADPGFVMDVFLRHLDLRECGPALKAYAEMDDPWGWMDITAHVVATADSFSGSIRTSLRLYDTGEPDGAEGALIGVFKAAPSGGGEGADEPREADGLAAPDPGSGEAGSTEATGPTGGAAAAGTARAAEFSGAFPAGTRGPWARTGFLLRESLRHARPGRNR